MGRFDDAADEAAKETDDELAEGLAKLAPPSEEKLKEMLPDQVDRDLVNSLIKDVKSATDSNARRQKLASFAAIASAGAMKVVKLLK